MQGSVSMYHAGYASLRRCRCVKAVDCLCQPPRYSLSKRYIFGWLTYAKQHKYMSLNQTTIGSDNGLSPVRCQAILWTHADSLSLSNEPLATNLSEISMKMNMFAFKKMYFKMPCAKWWPFYHSSPCVEYTMILSLKKMHCIKLFGANINSSNSS